MKFDTGIRDGILIANDTFYVGTISYTWNLKRGWNLISLPVIPTSNKIEDIFAGVNVISVYTWDPSLKRYVTVNEMEIGKGYWVLVLEDVNVTIEGSPLESMELSIESIGWNLIGTISKPALLSVYPSNAILTTIYMWDPEGKRYSAVNITSETLDAGYGYWILVLNPCTIKIMD